MSINIIGKRAAALKRYVWPGKCRTGGRTQSVGNGKDESGKRGASETENVGAKKAVRASYQAHFKGTPRSGYRAATRSRRRRTFQYVEESDEEPTKVG